MESNYPVDYFEERELPIFYFKSLRKDGQPMTEKEIANELECMGENREVIYENNVPVGFIELWKERD